MDRSVVRLTVTTTPSSSGMGRVIVTQRWRFASPGHCLSRNAAAVAEEMGNSPGVVRTHYQNISSPEHATAWWKVIPAPPPAPPIPFRKARAAS